ncbi:MAG TPA: replicative DNA helicase [Spirochaetia bacterium]|nr:MAG: replicative DNA helicase [Spirochaetes bacterium GWB1_36_13]HCL56589.1 replicative DNA helicase [Spirochaetia bacterium]
MAVNKTMIPPQSIESEQACLGAILIDPGFAMTEIMSLLIPEDFYHTANQIVFQSMSDLFKENQPIDLITLTQKLKEKGQLENCGGAVYVSSLTTVVPTSGNVVYYAQKVKEKSQLRSLLEASSKIYEMACDESQEIESILEESEKMIFKIAETRVNRNPTPVRTVLMQLVNIIEERKKRKGYTGIPSGFKNLDDMTYGFQNSNLIILAARPSMGKTALALNIAQNITVKSQKTVLFFSLEMSKDELVQRLISSEGRIDATRLRSGFLETSDWTKLKAAAGKLSEAKLYIEDAPGLSYIDIRAISRRLKARGELDMVVIDYLQIISPPAGKREENRQNTVAEISRNLKFLAKELDIPVIALSQLSRGVESRTIKEPMLSDLRESGSIEQDADVVLFIHRPAYYNKEVDENLKNLAEIHIAKQRSGPVGKLNLTFMDKYTCFEDWIDSARIEG